MTAGPPSQALDDKLRKALIHLNRDGDTIAQAVTALEQRCDRSEDKAQYDKIMAALLRLTRRFNYLGKLVGYVPALASADPDPEAT